MSNTATPTALPPLNDRIKAAAFGVATTLSTPKYNFSSETVDKVARTLVGNMKKADARIQGLAGVIREHLAEQKAAA